MIHWNLADYYTFVDLMVSEHKYSKSDVDNLIPFERDVFVSLINDRINSKPSHGQQVEAPTEF